VKVLLAEIRAAIGKIEVYENIYRAGILAVVILIFADDRLSASIGFLLGYIGLAAVDLVLATLR